MAPIRCVLGLATAALLLPLPCRGQQANGSDEDEKDDKTRNIVGVAVGLAAISFAGRSIKRTKREKERIQAMADQHATAADLQALARRGELPGVCIVRGVLSAEGHNVGAAAPKIEGLSSQVGTIDQPENCWIEVARLSKNEPQLKDVTDELGKSGVSLQDVPDVEDDFSHRNISVTGGPVVLAECLVSRLCCLASRRTETVEDPQTKAKTKKITIHRHARAQSYYVFHGRRVSPGLYLADVNGKKLGLSLPPANVTSTLGLGEPPPLFLSTADAMLEFGNMLRREGLKVQGEHVDLSQLPPTKLSTPNTFLSKHVILDVQSLNDLGVVGGNRNVLARIGEMYGSGPKSFLWEPLGFYDQDEKSSRPPSYASYAKRELVTAGQLLQRAAQAAQENTARTPFCEPTFSRAQLASNRDAENCFRFSELAIARGSPVTILARPVEDGSGGIRLVCPSDAEGGRSSHDPDADRFRFRILKGHTVENLLKQRDLNAMTYYGVAVAGLLLAASCSYNLASG